MAETVLQHATTKEQAQQFASVVEACFEKYPLGRFILDPGGDEDSPKVTLDPVELMGMVGSLRVELISAEIRLLIAQAEAEELKGQLQRALASLPASTLN
jgi:hypothetical protein